MGKLNPGFMAEIFKLMFSDEVIMRIASEYLKYELIPKEWVGYKFILREAIIQYTEKNKLPSIGVICQKLCDEDAVQLAAQIVLGGLADGIEILFAHHGAAERGKTEHLADPLKGKVHIHVLFLGFHIKGRLGAVHLEPAHRLKAVAQDLHHGCFKLVAVEAFQGHFALIAHNNFLHKCCIS